MPPKKRVPLNDPYFLGGVFQPHLENLIFTNWIISLGVKTKNMIWNHHVIQWSFYDTGPQASSTILREILLFDPPPKKKNGSHDPWPPVLGKLV